MPFDINTYLNSLSDNTVYINLSGLIKLKKITKIINKFRYFYYSLKFKKQFIKWLWKSREKKIIEKYHPKYLLEYLEDNTDLDEFLNNW